MIKVYAIIVVEYVVTSNIVIIGITDPDTKLSIFGKVVTLFILLLMAPRD